MLPGTKGKAHKKKASVAFGVENIDNTAPVKNILDELQHKNNQAFTYYCQTLRPRRSTKDDYNFHHTLPGHPVFAFSEDWDGDLNSGIFEPFSYKSLMPKIITQVHNTDRHDPVAKLLRMKSDWFHDCKNMRNVAVKSSMAENYYTLNEEVVHCPKHLVDLAAQLDNDPDPYFDDTYNWYYAGNGNMQFICLNWVDYILCSEFGTLYLLPFSKHEQTVKGDHIVAYDCGLENILEVICSTQNIIALRTKYKVFILKVSCENENVHCEKIKSVESELPFTGVSFDNCHKNILYITSLNCKVILVNLDRITARTVQLKIRSKTLVNNWNTVISLDRVTYAHVTKNFISLYDKRTNSVTQTINNIRDVTDHLGCDNVSVAKHHDGSTNFYYATDHHIFLLDIRHQNKNNPKHLLRWTHGMQSVPTCMTVCNFEFNKELVCLSSQWCEDICVVPSYNIGSVKEGDINGITMPYRPPNILTTLKHAREKLLCFDLYNSIEQRLATAVTGQIIYEEDENYIILMQNALGDITCHLLYPEHMETLIDDFSIEHLQNWSKSYKVKRKPFEISTVQEISGIWKDLMKVPEHVTFKNRSRQPQYRMDKIRNVLSETFKKEDIDHGLIDVWNDDLKDTTALDNSSLAINLHYSDEHSDLSEN